MESIFDYLDEHWKQVERETDAWKADKFSRVDDIELKELEVKYPGRLFLGCKLSDRDMLWWLKHHQIKIVISLGFEQSPWHELKEAHNGEPYMDVRQLYNYSIEDTDKPEDIQHMRTLLPLIEQIMRYHLSRNENVMVHCHWGMSRSATCVLWFLTRHGIPLYEAVKHVKERRPVVYPKRGFLSLCQ